jgi:hypothetical protein
VYGKWLPYSLVPGFYLFWRIFLFDNERATTDAGLQLGALVDTPLSTLYTWIGNAIQSFLNVTPACVGGAALRSFPFPLDVSNSDARHTALLSLWRWFPCW